MKKNNVLIILAFLAGNVIGITTTNVNAQDVLPGDGGEYPEQLKYYDAQIDVLLPYLDQFQQEYFVLYERYYQALISHSQVPETLTTPDKLTYHPTDQAENLAYLWDRSYLPAEIAWAFSIDVYSGPGGDGYVLNIEALVDQVTWIRSINVGPETNRSQGWFEKAAAGEL